MPDDEVDTMQQAGVYQKDLEDLLALLKTVYHFCLAYDLFNQYKNLSISVQPSPLTKRVKVMVNRFQGYLDDLNNDEDDDVSE